VIDEDDDVDCPECDGPTVEVDDVGSGQVMRQCQVCHYAWAVWP